MHYITQPSIGLTQPSVESFGIPLLDEGFDPSEEEIFDHSELTPLHLSEAPEREFEF